MTRNKYYRLIIIACLDTLFNLPVLIVSFAIEIAQGKDNDLNHPYISWKNVHDGAGGNAPGLSLSSILQTPASVWSTEKWQAFIVKWDEWLYVVHAIVFFCVFGTTPEMRRYYRSLFHFAPYRYGLRRRNISDSDTISNIQFISNPDQRKKSSTLAPLK